MVCLRVKFKKNGSEGWARRLQSEEEKFELYFDVARRDAYERQRVEGGRADIHRRLFEERKEERDAALAKVRRLRMERIQEEERLSTPGLRKTNYSEVGDCLIKCND